LATVILVDNGFNGTIYNMLGGMNAWKAAGYPTVSGGFTNITVGNAWEFLTNTDNGIQIPVDVRTDDEWKTEHIDTPYPENPIHYPLTDLQNATKLLEFMALYTGMEIIFTCKGGGRSLIASQILVDNGFNGTVYNMLGGITAWKNAGYPTINNRAPNIPVITGPTKGKVGEEYPYSFVATDPDYDNVYYSINWSDDTGEMYIGPYPSGEEVILNHTWFEKGTYIIKAKASDRYGNESDWGTLEVKMPKSKTEANLLYQRFVQNHPNLLLILQMLFQRLGLL
jgi:rhodanese-related sulfurtransferase